MSFADPESITIGGVTTSLPRTSFGDNKPEYSSSDGLIRLSASHAYGKRIRRVIRLDHSKVAANPFDSSVNAKYSMSNYMVFDVPPVGYSVANILDVYIGFKDLLIAGGSALPSKLVGGES